MARAFRVRFLSVSRWSYFYRSAQAFFVLAARPRHSLCRHGSNCRRHANSSCGFAHRIDEIAFPAGTDARSIKDLDKRRWVCDVHVPQGHPGYDKYVGQRLSPYQWGRILLYVILQHMSVSKMKQLLVGILSRMSC